MVKGASYWTATSFWEYRPKRLSYKLATEGMEAKRLRGKRLRVQDDDDDDDGDDDVFVTNWSTYCPFELNNWPSESSRRDEHDGAIRFSWILQEKMFVWRKLILCFAPWFFENMFSNLDFRVSIFRFSIFRCHYIYIYISIYTYIYICIYMYEYICIKV